MYMDGKVVSNVVWAGQARCIDERRRIHNAQLKHTSFNNEPSEGASELALRDTKQFA